MAFAVPGEEVAGVYYDALKQILKGNWLVCARGIDDPREDGGTASMRQLLIECQQALNKICSNSSANVELLAEEMLHRLTRESLEVRGLAIVFDKATVHVLLGCCCALQ